MTRLIEKIEYYLHLNITGKVSDRLTLDYIEMEVKKYQKSIIEKTHYGDSSR